jgi:hypothetical protein
MRWLDMLLTWLDTHAPSMTAFESLDAPAIHEVCVFCLVSMMCVRAVTIVHT